MGSALPSALFLRRLTISSSVLDGWRFGKRSFTSNLLPNGIVDTPSLNYNLASSSYLSIKSSNITKLKNRVLISSYNLYESLSVAFSLLRLGTILTYYSIILKLTPLYLHSVLFFRHLHRFPLYLPFFEVATSASLNDDYI